MPLLVGMPSDMSGPQLASGYYFVSVREVGVRELISHRCSVDLSNGVGTTDQMPFEDVEVLQLLGKGSFGRVYMGRFLDTQDPCAIKVTITNGGSSNSVNRVVSTGNMLSRMGQQP